MTHAPDVRRAQPPRGDLVTGVVDEQTELEGVLSDLKSQGLSSDRVIVFQGQRGWEEMANVGGSGLGGRFHRALHDYVGNAKELIDRHKDEVVLGHYVVVAQLGDSRLEHRVHEVLTSHGGHAIFARIHGTYTALAN